MHLVLQYGFVTLFVSTFPLAPMFALLNNIFEVRIDAHKMLCDLRRPFPRRVTSLGAWEDILQGVTYTAVVFNVRKNNRSFGLRNSSLQM